MSKNPLLDTIGNPQDLRAMSVEQLGELAAEMREAISAYEDYLQKLCKS